MQNALILNETDLRRIIEEITANVLRSVTDFPEVMTQKQAAKYLQVTVPTISAWMKRENDPLPVVYLDSLPRYRKCEIGEWLKRQPRRHLRRD